MAVPMAKVNDSNNEMMRISLMNEALYVGTSTSQIANIGLIQAYIGNAIINKSRNDILLLNISVC